MYTIYKTYLRMYGFWCNAWWNHKIRHRQRDHWSTIQATQNIIVVLLSVKTSKEKQVKTEDTDVTAQTHKSKSHNVIV